MSCDKCGAEEKTYLYEGLLLCEDCLNLFQGIVDTEHYPVPIEGLFEENAYTKEERERIDFNELKRKYRYNRNSKDKPINEDAWTKP